MAVIVTEVKHVNEQHTYEKEREKCDQRTSLCTRTTYAHKICAAYCTVVHMNDVIHLGCKTGGER
jgi:hypothetical protein